MPLSLLLFGFNLAFGLSSALQQAAPRLELRASTREPYIGQQIDLILEVDIPDTLGDQWRQSKNNAQELQIPWLFSEFGFSWSLPPEQWLCDHTGFEDGVRFKVPPWPHAVSSDIRPQSGRWHAQFRWKLTIRQPDVIQEGVIRFEPAQLKYGEITITSNPLELQVRELPLPPTGVEGINLGIGELKLEMSIDRPEIELGEEVSLSLKIIGNGDLTAVERPVLARLKSFQPFLIEDGHENWGEDGGWREFRYTLRPRQAGKVNIPPITAFCFDPAKGEYVSSEAASLILAVRSTADKHDRSTAVSLPARSRIPFWLFLVGLSLSICGGLILASWALRPIRRVRIMRRRQRSANSALRFLGTMTSRTKADAIDEAAYTASEYVNESRAAIQHGKLMELAHYGPPLDRDTLQAEVIRFAQQVIQESVMKNGNFPESPAQPRSIIGPGLRTLLPFALISAGLILSSLAWVQKRYEELYPVAVVTAETLLRKGNGESYAPQTVDGAPVRLQPGAVGRVRSFKNNGWVQLQLVDGTSGWVRRDLLIVDSDQL